jgi:ribokinase
MILVFGSINVDVVVPVPRLPGAGETVLGDAYSLLPGGKGANQALAARRAGADVAIAGAVGRDAFAPVALDPLRAAGVDIGRVRAVEASTGCAAIIVAKGGENMIAVASGANAAVRCDQAADADLGPGVVLVTQMEVPPAETFAMIRRARTAGASMVLNLAPALSLPSTLLSAIDLLVANEQEAATLGEDAVSVAARLRQGLIVTQGAAGACAYLAAGGTIRVPALQVDAIDTTGAGDTFVGVLAAALDRGLLLETSLRQASAAAGLACMAAGAQTAMPDLAAIAEAAARLPRC